LVHSCFIKNAPRFARRRFGKIDDSEFSLYLTYTDNDNNSDSYICSGSSIYCSKAERTYIPSSYYPSELTFSDQFDKMSFVVRRKFFFGSKFVPVKIVSSLQQRSKRWQESPKLIPQFDASKESDSLLYFQCLSDFISGEIFIGFDPQRRSLITTLLSLPTNKVNKKFLADLFELESKLETDEIKRLRVKNAKSKAKNRNSEYIVHDYRPLEERVLQYSCKHDDDSDVEDDEFQIHNIRFQRGILLHAIVAAAIQHRFRSPQPPILLDEFVPWKANCDRINGLGTEGKLEECMGLIPRDIWEYRHKDFWREECSECLKVMDEHNPTNTDLEKIVICSLSLEISFGAHWFYCEKSEGLSFLGEECYICMNNRGVHFCEPYSRDRVYSVEFERVIRWGGTSFQLSLSLDIEKKNFEDNEMKPIPVIEFKCHCKKSMLFRHALLEFIHTLMTHHKKDQNMLDSGRMSSSSNSSSGSDSDDDEKVQKNEKKSRTKNNGWNLAFDEKAGKVYIYHRKTRETAWCRDSTLADFSWLDSFLSDSDNDNDNDNEII